MSVWFKSRLNPWYIWIPSNPNLVFNQNYYENAMANNSKQCFNTHYQSHCHPTTKSLWLCSSVYCRPPHQSRRIWLVAAATNQKYSCPSLALAAICGKNKACSGGYGGTTLQNKACGTRRYWAAGANVTTTTHKLYVHITKVGIWPNTPIQVICAFMYLVVEEAVRTAKVRRSSHRKSASL